VVTVIAFGAHWPQGQPLQKEIKMFSLISRFRSDERGATATEYAMLIVFVALAIAVGAQALGNDLTLLFTNVGTTLTGITIPTP
jgi:pilus assembly protein Flp/PilA